MNFSRKALYENITKLYYHSVGLAFLTKYNILDFILLYKGVSDILKKEMLADKLYIGMK